MIELNRFWLVRVSIVIGTSLLSTWEIIRISPAFVVNFGQVVVPYALYIWLESRTKTNEGACYQWIAALGICSAAMAARLNVLDHLEGTAGFAIEWVRVGLLQTILVGVPCGVYLLRNVSDHSKVGIGEAMPAGTVRLGERSAKSLFSGHILAISCVLGVSMALLPLYQVSPLGSRLEAGIHVHHLLPYWTLIWWHDHRENSRHLEKLSLVICALQMLVYFHFHFRSSVWTIWLVPWMQLILLLIWSARGRKRNLIMRDQ